MNDYTLEPIDFAPSMHVVAVYVRVGDDILLLRRHKTKDYGGYWCAPAGKRSENESLEAAAQRELLEETGISQCVLRHAGSFTVRYPEYDYTYDTYVTRLSQKPKIHINAEEHSAYAWVNLAAYHKQQTVPLEGTCLLASLSNAA